MNDVIELEDDVAAYGHGRRQGNSKYLPISRRILHAIATRIDVGRVELHLVGALTHDEERRASAARKIRRSDETKAAQKQRRRPIAKPATQIATVIIHVATLRRYRDSFGVGRARATVEGQALLRRIE